jgi:ABC-type multidrug transport system fused ATPase/permease subunit
LKKLAKNISGILTRTEKKWFWVLTASDIFINILDIVFLASLIIIINYYTQQNYIPVHFTFLGELMEKKFYLVIALFALLFSFKNFVAFLAIKKVHHFAYNVALRISQNALSDYLSSDYANYANTDSSVHIRKISQQAIQFGQYILLNCHQIISQLVLIVIAIVVIMLFNATLFLLLLFVIIPPVILTAWIMKKKLQSLRHDAKVNSEKSIQHLYEALNGYVESNIFGRKHFFTNRFAEFQKKMNHHIASQQTIQGFPGRLIEIFAILGLCALIMIGKQYGNSGMPVLLIGAFMGAAYKIIPGIVKILNCASQIKAYQFTITDLLHHGYTPGFPEKENPAEIFRVEFENVSFGYDDRNVLDKINFTINKGDFVGLRGISGKGKTTAINLLIGFAEPCAGAIRINDYTAKKSERLSYIKNISYAKQQPFFIRDTLQKNILFNDEHYDPAKLNELISLAGIDKIIRGHTEGLQFMIEENGKNISGGERQRIVFARALYKEADLIILDEPFTELDETSGIAMTIHLQKLANQGKIIILAAHNKNSFTYCNKIISLND